MCMVCIEETGVALTVLFTMFPFLRAKYTAWRRQRQFKAVQRRSMFGRWA
jgi:hypothetical protein